MKKSSELQNYGTAFFGTSKLAVYVFDELEKAKKLPDVVVTMPDSPAGRGLALREPAVKTWAQERDIPILQPGTLKGGDPDEDMLMNTDWKLFVVADYGLIIPKRVLDVPWAGTLNVHPSLLPKYRGPSPIASQILNDEKDTGVSIMVVDEELDHGPVVAQASISPDPWPLKASVLGEILMREGGRLLSEIVDTWCDEASFDEERGDERTLIPAPQEHTRATFTSKFSKEDGLLDLNADAYKNYLTFCAFDEWPGTYFFAETKRGRIRVKIRDAEFSDGVFVVLSVIPEGKKEMPYADFMRGA